MSHRVETLIIDSIIQQPATAQLQPIKILLPIGGGDLIICDETDTNALFGFGPGGYFELYGQASAPAVAPVNNARLYYDSIAQELRLSTNTGGYEVISVSDPFLIETIKQKPGLGFVFETNAGTDIATVANGSTNWKFHDALSIGGTHIAAATVDVQHTASDRIALRVAKPSGDATGLVLIEHSDTGDDVVAISNVGNFTFGNYEADAASLVGFNFVFDNTILDPAAQLMQATSGGAVRFRMHAQGGYTSEGLWSIKHGSLENNSIGGNTVFFETTHGGSMDIGGNNSATNFRTGATGEFNFQRNSDGKLYVNLQAPGTWRLGASSNGVIGGIHTARFNLINKDSGVDEVLIAITESNVQTDNVLEIRRNSDEDFVAGYDGNLEPFVTAVSGDLAEDSVLPSPKMNFIAYADTLAGAGITATARVGTIRMVVDDASDSHIEFQAAGGAVTKMRSNGQLTSGGNIAAGGLGEFPGTAHMVVAQSGSFGIDDGTDTGVFTPVMFGDSAKGLVFRPYNNLNISINSSATNSGLFIDGDNDAAIITQLGAYTGTETADAMLDVRGTSSIKASLRLRASNTDNIDAIEIYDAAGSSKQFAIDDDIRLIHEDGFPNFHIVKESDGASALAHVLASTVNYSNKSAKLLSLGDNYSLAGDTYDEKFFVESDGSVSVGGSHAIGQSSVSLTADNQVVDTTGKSYIQMSSDDGTASNRDFVLDQGDRAGHELTLEWTGTNAGQLIDDSAVSGGGNHRLSADWVPTQYDVIKLRWNGIDWIEQSRSAN